MAFIDFGYTVNRDRQIDFDALDRDFYLALAKKEPTVKSCISCGTCAATCSAGQFTDYSLRRMILLIRRGMLNDLKSNVSKCMLCGKCQLVCPMGVNTRNLIYSIQELIENTSKN